MQAKSMSRAHRAFWMLALLLELAVLVSVFVVDRLTLRLVLLGATLLPVALLALQRRWGRHNFWAGYLGIYVLFAPAWISAMWAGLVALGSIGLPPLLLAMVLYLLTLLAVAMYVFASPRLWFAAAE
ncbi:hypothetical protein [Noviluteimonas gilva]|uniref:DUF2069 domain-containing protein n=1 Tax=Noviluteimonas gilva TaxID=2682097 RepID=A0A7C9MMQ7_9GAMM|nr:hypothetical protein [Lysobacter gilvus]MUV14607.1 hypothetical protein [Lysobacter gilvus]